MSLHVAGLNDFSQLGTQSDCETPDGKGFVSNLKSIAKNKNNIISLSPGWQHTVIAMNDGSVVAAGNDQEFKIGIGSRSILNRFRAVTVSEQPIKCVACGSDFTLYLDQTGSVYQCHMKAQGERIKLPLEKKAISVIGGREYGAIIDEEGAVYFLNVDDPHMTSKRITFPQPAIDVACCVNFSAVLLKDGSVYGNMTLNNGNAELCRVESLIDKKIKKIAGISFTCLAVDEDGAVYAYGGNEAGQLGNGTKINDYSSFKLVSALSGKKVKDVACSFHSLFLTEDDELYGCGLNMFAQLLTKTKDNFILDPMLLAKDKNIGSIFVGNSNTIILCDHKVENPARSFFMPTEGDSNQAKLLQEVLAKNESLEEEVSELKTLVMKLSDEIDEMKKINKQILEEINDLKNPNQEKVVEISQTLSESLTQTLGESKETEKPEDDEW